MSYNEWLDIDVLEDYLDGKLDAKAMHQVEKLSLEDPFVAEALTGLSQSPKRTQSLSLLQKQLQERVAQKPVEKKRWVITSQRLSIGSAAAVLFISVSILFWMKANKRQEMLAANTPKNVDVKIAPEVATNKIETKPRVPDQIKETSPIVAKTPNIPQAKKPIAIAETPIVAVERPPVAAAVVPALVAKSSADQALKEEAIIVSEKKAKSEASRSAVMALPSKADGITSGYFSGKVISKETGMPIPGAIVKVAGIDRGTTTDKQGEFKLSADSAQNQKLTIGYLGFTTTEVGVKSNQPVNILLENDNNRLQEVVVVTGQQTNAMPLGGWENYQKYLKANNKLSKNKVELQEVELDFQVRKDGSVTAVKVVKSGGKVNDVEAIRLLKDGPKWIFVPNATNYGKLTIKF